MKPSFLCSILLIAFLSIGVTATSEKALSKAQKRLAKVQEDYTATGTVKNCILLRSLRESKVIDDQTIFFKRAGGTAYLNKLPRTCSRLAAEERFSYRTSMGKLCHLDVITVVDNFGRSLSRCGLGKFEELKKNTANDSEQSQD